MANEVLIKSKTTTTYTSSGGDKTMTMSSVGNNAGRMGPSLDLGTPRPGKYRVTLISKYGTAPTKGTTLDLYFMTSPDNSNWDAALTPSDAALGSVDSLPQLLPVGQMVLDDINTAQQQSFEIVLFARYIAPVIYNNGTGQSLGATGTDHKIIIEPIADEIQ